MENEVKFENRFYADRTVLKEYIKHVFCKTTRIMGIILMAVSLCGFGLSLFAGFKVSESLLFIFCFFGGVLIYCYYFFVVREMQKQSGNLHGGVLPPTVIKFGDKIEMTEGKIHMEFEYQQIIKIYKLPNLYALMIGRNQAILAAKDGFVKGTKEEFERFIEEKIRN